MSGGASLHSRRDPSTRRLVIGVLAVLTVVIAALVAMVIAGIFSSLHTRSLEEPIPGGVSTTGTVIAVERVPSKGGYVYAQVVRFLDAQGIAHQVSGPTSSDRPTVGAPAAVSYLPGNPHHAHDLSASSSAWQWPFYTCVFLLVPALPGFAFIVWLLVRATSR